MYELVGVVDKVLKAIAAAEKRHDEPELYRLKHCYADVVRECNSRYGSSWVGFRKESV